MTLNMDLSSTCDVCMEPFTVPGQDTDQSKCPHTISCGHVFCRSCLLNIREMDGLAYPVCPHCRKPYRREKVRALFVAVDPERNKPAPERLSNAVRRIDATVNEMRRTDTDFFPQDLTEALDDVNRFVQNHSGADLPTARLMDAFATVLEKYSENRRQLSYTDYRSRRHLREQKEDTQRRDQLEQTYLDALELLQNQIFPRRAIIPDLPQAQKVPDHRKRRSTVGVASIPPSPSSALVDLGRRPYLRADIQRLVQTSADQRLPLPDAGLEFDTYANSINTGNALGLGDEDPQNAQQPTAGSRLLFNGRIEPDVAATDRYPPSARVDGAPRVTGGDPNVNQSVPMGDSDYSRRRARRASTGSRIAPLAHASGSRVADTSARDLASDRVNGGFYDAGQSRNRPDTATASSGYEDSNGYANPAPANRSHDIGIGVPLHVPGVDRTGQRVSADARNFHANAATEASLGSRGPQAGSTYLSAPAPPSIARAVSLHAQASSETEYSTPRSSGPATPYSSTQPTPPSGSLHTSPNPGPHPPIPIPDPRTRVYPPTSLPAAAPHQPSAQPARVQAPTHTRGHSYSNAAAGQSPIPPPAANMIPSWEASPIPLTGVRLDDAAPIRVGQPPVTNVRQTSTRRNDTLLF